MGTRHNSVRKIIAFFLVLGLLSIGIDAHSGIMPLGSKRHWQAHLFIANQIKGIGVVDSYQEDNGARSYVYDNSLAAISSMLMGEFGLAKEILDTLTLEVKKTEEGVPFEYYNCFDFNGGGGGLAYCGNSAWLLQALNIYQKFRSSTVYYYEQRKLADYLLTLQDPVDGGLRGSPFDSWKSTEHNIIAYAALKTFGQLNSLPEYINQAEKIKDFLTSPVIWDGVRFNRGPADPSRVVDVQALGVLLLGRNYSSALTWAEQNLRLTRPFGSESVTGFDFDGNLDTVWLEGTLQMALAFSKSGSYQTGAYYFSEAVKVVQSDGSLLLATNTGTASDTWILYRWRAIAPTSWLIIYYFKFNPLVVD